VLPGFVALATLPAWGDSMIALIQRVLGAHVEIEGRTVGAIEHGLVVLVCAEPQDTELMADKLVSKLLKLRIFNDEHGKMNRSVVDVKGGLLIVSQFTLAADTRSGNRPSFTGAAGAALGQTLYERVVSIARSRHTPVATGQFGADMRVHLVNDGPVTISMTVDAKA
jgi:D-aminoacyl-tRNA deacylase